ncbi:type I-E CRISPR-associated protein Cse2/CasB [Streptomyces sp. MC1]|uniref:type I-E CRISPR-associated protein Cse2/CasB n=1 Tax=Streptomyces sp. MC1 TaxID=295105 RepID=UPI0018CAA9E8|nr:type I-E CRISPR-associated protein Cse2/CasB [Streptomyces sp. MC1]MBG7704668.1 type I-E CRISPR-associated protein Cse2/CasB [Streptomyces sp. MC1]
MTTTALAPAGMPERVRHVVGEHVTRLQRGYLADESHAVAALARLRRGAGKEPHQVPDLLGLIDTGLLYGPLPSGWAPREEDLTQAEDAVHVALTLWALHQQSKSTGMHQPDSRERPLGLGAGVRRLMPAGDIDETVLKRLVRAGTAPHLAGLAQRLRDIVVLLRREDIALDYALLADQLYRWQQPGGRDAVRRLWGRSFHSYQPRQNSQPGAEGTGAVSASTDFDDTVKDAS